MAGFASGIEHLVAELHLLDLAMRRQVMRLRAAQLFNEDEMRGLYIPDEQIDALLSSSVDDVMIPEQESEAIEALTSAIVSLRQQIDERIQDNQELPLVQLAAIFDLTPFECQLLVLSVASELMPRFETLFAYAQNDVTRKHPCVDLALTLFCQHFSEYVAHRGSFAPDAPLLRHHLLRLLAPTPESGLPARNILAEPRIVDFLLARQSIDERLTAFTHCQTPTLQLHDLIVPDVVRASLVQITHLCACGNMLVCLHGPTGTGKQATAEAVGAAINRSLLIVDASRIPSQDVALLAALLRREALLQRAALYLAHSEQVFADEQTGRAFLPLMAMLRHAPFPIFLGSEYTWRLPDEWPETRCVTLHLPLPDFSQRLQHWRLALNTQGCTTVTDEDMIGLANQFLLSGRQIRETVHYAVTNAALRSADATVVNKEHLYAEARQQSHSSLSQLAQKVELAYSWDDIVLPQRVLHQLHEVCAAVIYRHIVFSQWGFERKLALGKGVNILFSGTSGTGKTMAASIIAQELRRDLYKIDLAQLVSKYIGETEKNLSRIFQEAQASNALLFFDEADALFGKRSEVKDAHDRYANIEVAYLLQKMEEYTGIVILATNLSKNLDDAFARRMQHVIEFPFPDAALRERIWRKMFPAEAPLVNDIDFGFLARQFEVAGGNIRNITLAGAFMAAEEGSSIGMEQLIIAVARELRKMGKMPSQANFQTYYDLVRQKS